MSAAPDATAVRPPLVQLEGVVKRYEGRVDGDVLAGVDLSLAAGETLAVVGPSGSGKSTLLHLIGGLDTPTTGVVRVAGADLASLEEDARADLRNQEIGFVFQAHHLLPQLTALENVLVPTLVGGTRPEQVDRALELLGRAGLEARKDQRPGQLSGGECQRVALVRALIMGPSLLLADEPTGSLDAEAAERMGDLLEGWNREHHLAMVLVTHSMELARRMQRTLVLRRGLLHEEPAA